VAFEDVRRQVDGFLIPAGFQIPDKSAIQFAVRFYWRAIVVSGFPLSNARSRIAALARTTGIKGEVRRVACAGESGEPATQLELVLFARREAELDGMLQEIAAAGGWTSETARGVDYGNLKAAHFRVHGSGPKPLHGEEAWTARQRPRTAWRLLARSQADAAMLALRHFLWSCPEPRQIEQRRH
jgi:hypothetical protein